MKKMTLHTSLKILLVLAIFMLLLAPTDAYAFSISTFIKNSVANIKSLISSGVDAVKEVASFVGIVDKDCKVPVVSNVNGEITSGGSNCLFCPMFEVLFNASSAVAAASYRAFKSDLGKVLLVFLAVVLALNILKNLASMGAKDTGAILNDLFSRTFVCVAIYIIITRDYYNMMNMTILPVLEDGMSFVGLNGGMCKIDANLSGFINRIGSGLLTGDFGETIPHKIGVLIITAICNIEQRINVLFDYSEWAWCRGTGPDKILFVLPHPIYIIDSILLFLGGLFFMVAYPWVLADAVLQLGISLALFPFAVVGYAFGHTKKYLPKLFSWVLNSLFVFIFMSILLTCVLGYIAKLLGLIFLNVGDYSLFFTDPNSGIAFYGPNMMKILFVLVIGWTYMPLARDLAAKFAEGSGLSAAQATGDAFVTNPVENYTRKAADYTAQAAGNAALSIANSTGRRFNALNRHGAILMAKTFGSTDADGNKTVNFAGMRFTAEQNPQGKSVLRREYKTFNGRRHVMLSDKYSTIYQVYDSNGNLISSRAEFKHNFAKKYLFNENGEVNVGALQTLLDSPLGQDPAHRQAIMEQIAVNAAKNKGYKIGTYYNKRIVRFDPNNPTKISVEQIDHAGSVTSFSLDVNMQTGQTAVGYAQDVAPTAPLRTLGRKGKIKMHKLFMGQTGHYTAAGTLAFTTWLGTRYEMLTDPATGEEYYTRERRKFIFFGKKEIKEFHADGTVRHVQRSARAQAKDAAQEAKIAAKLNGETERKTLFHTYRSYVNDAGETVYTQNLRAGWNLKNYFRATKGTAAFATRVAFKSIPQAVVKASTSIITTAFSPASWGHIPSSFSARAKTIGNIFVDDWNKSFSGTIQTGDVTHYSSSGKVKKDSLTGQTATVNLNDYTVVTGVNGEKVVQNNLTGETSDQSTERQHRREFYFSNGVLELRTNGYVDEKGNIIKEKTKFNYSKAAQYGHDSILSEDDSYQIVNKRGVISDKLQPTLADGSPNPLNLVFGLDNISGVTSIGGQPTSSFIVNNILAEGRRRGTNSMSTNFLNVLNS